MSFSANQIRESGSPQTLWARARGQDGWSSLFARLWTETESLTHLYALQFQSEF